MVTTSAIATKTADFTPLKPISSLSSHPSTPVSNLFPSTPVDSPGTWRHPRLDEIARRRGTTNFTESNISMIAYNLGALLLLWLSPLLARQYISANLVPAFARDYVSWAYMGMLAIPLVNAVLAFLPLFRKPDPLLDIPLTPAQRKLLGLPPSPALASPSLAYITPPRYSRTPSLVGSVGSRGSLSSSPLSGRGSPVAPATLAGSASSFSPSTPLQRKSRPEVIGRVRRSSLGSSTAFGSHSNDANGGTVKPGKRASVGLNSKWLYERGRRSSGSAWMY